MTFAAPWFLAAGLALAGAVVALHFLARQRPRDYWLPTARFVPQVSLRAPSPASSPADLPLLALRVLVVLLLAGAFARPMLNPPRHTARIILADVSRAPRSLAEVRDSVAALWRDGDLILAFDSSVRQVRHPDGLAGSAARGSLTAALVLARRLAAQLREADSVELILVSSFAADQWDGATASVRVRWPGRARLVSVRAAEAGAHGVTMAAGMDDPVRASLFLAGVLSPLSSADVRVVRVPPSPADTAWAQAGGALIVWPASVTGWTAGPGDTVNAVATPGAAMVAPFVRTADPPSGSPVAWWIDGRPAATEQPLGRGCLRSVSLAFPSVGDRALSSAAQRVALDLTQPCGGGASAAPLEDAKLRLLEGSGPLLVPDQYAQNRVPASAWLLLTALGLVLLEPMARRRRNG
ncbi:MAG TPA: BatA domain-containing protein [Gemmatimonadales bacterium]|nr:BatA domain-containing protein [Gemmatimonadales bacterium]